MGRAKSDGVRESEGGRLHGWVHRMSGKGRPEFVLLVLPGQNERGCVCMGASCVIKHKKTPSIKYLLGLSLHQLLTKYQGRAGGRVQSENKSLKHYSTPQSNNFVSSVIPVGSCDYHDDVTVYGISGGWVIFLSESPCFDPWLLQSVCLSVSSASYWTPNSWWLWWM